MKINPNMQVVYGCIAPHHHTSTMDGPVNMVIAYKYQPPVLTRHKSTKKVSFWVSQPDEGTNLTIITLGFGRGFPAPVKTRSHRVKAWRMTSGALALYVRKRLYDSVPHPWPVGRWEGSCKHTDKWALFTLQQTSLKVKKTEPQRKILIPSDDEFGL